MVVTLLVALGIAAAQGCQGPARGLGDGRSGQAVSVSQKQKQKQERAPEQVLTRAQASVPAQGA